MATFLLDKNSKADIDIKSIAGRLLSMPIISLERIGGGLNSRVYLLITKDASKYVLKFYYRDNLSKRDRLKAEFLSLRFLWQNGVRCVPEPIAVNENKGCAIYRFIAGEKISPQKIVTRDIESAVEFFKELKNLKTAGKLFSPASEAFFSVCHVYENIQMRINRLMGIERGGEEHDSLRNYLANDFIPFWESLTHWAKNKLSDLGLSFVDSINKNDRTLSPSDFGFHNALRNKEGQIIFIDFEHFGWDDPAKIISDFLLHPAMSLDESLKQQFVTGILTLFKESTQLKHRVQILYPIFGLKWCLILLNEFIPADFRRRDFAQINIISKRVIYQEQLLKAKKMLNKMKQTYQEFPYDTSLIGTRCR